MALGAARLKKAEVTVGTARKDAEEGSAAGRGKTGTAGDGLSYKAYLFRVAQGREPAMNETLQA